MIYAILDNTTGLSGIVRNIAVGERPLNESWIDVTGVTPRPEKHWLYDGSIFTYSEKPETDFGTKLTPRALSRRLNPVIRAAIRNSVDEIVIDIREDLDLAEYVDLADPDVTTSLQYLVYSGVMTQDESDLVLNIPITETETY
jgi:hypothetical protein